VCGSGIALHRSSERSHNDRKTSVAKTVFDDASLLCCVTHRSIQVHGDGVLAITFELGQLTRAHAVSFILKVEHTGQLHRRHRH
jgi:hypothetical protein